ncbi:hypothetical protein F0562_007943 [Nyssa sinensis]|uniref:SMP domain-containing protein n=1 Tax=Nyssa sinensis TaxID=561372 RepID=A0A5J5A978_9ASTE|nr:hypothetical protein F0562_007943 [Nyssa sinensis]
MGLGFIGFTLVMSMLVSGLMGSVMGVECTLVRMGAAMLESLSGASNTGLVVTISEMGTHMLESILQTRCMVLESITLGLDIDMKEPGMREEGRVLVCTLSEIGETQSGHWQNGVLNVSSTQDTLGSPFSVDHSKVLNAVQEAQRAAGKAYDVARVDERVNKVVSSSQQGSQCS